jgi:hypothetical protein
MSGSKPPSDPTSFVGVGTKYPMHKVDVRGNMLVEGDLAVRAPAGQCSDLTPVFIGMHRNAPLSPMEEGARVHHSYGSYAPSAYGSY